MLGIQVKNDMAGRGATIVKIVGPRSARGTSRRRGVTIVELLIVVGILTILAAVALPTVRTLMHERKTSQAALLAKNYLETARARAIARNKPVAVVLERLSSRAIRDPNDASQLISVVASDTDLEANFAVYNSCIRLSMAEQPAAVQIDGVDVSRTSGSTDAELTLGSTDLRLSAIEEGAELEFPGLAGVNRRFRVEQISVPYANGAVTVIVDNFGTTASPYGAATDLNFMVRLAKRKVLRPHVPLGMFPVGTATPRFVTPVVIYPVPKPTSVQVLDLPRGTCIDLSLSGMANDSPLVMRGTANAVLASRRDTRRMFASNWSYTDAASPPTPRDLRPVYLIFNGAGTLERIMMNDFGGSGDAKDGSNELETYEALEDVFLYVGRTDQVIDAISYSDVAPEALEAESLEANLNDGTANWVRISPSSGAIAVAPAASYADGGSVAADIPIGQLLLRSRKLSFTDTETSQ